MGMFNWRRDPSNPYLPADGNLAQMNSNSMEGYKPLNAMTPNGNGMNGYRPNPTPNGFSVPNQQHGGMAQPNLEGYGESLQAASNTAAQAQVREQQIADIQSQIQTLEARIAENQSKLKNWTGNADKIAAIEARKFNSSDPTSIWRWKVDKDEARKIANAEKEKGDELTKRNAQYEIDNELDSMIVDDTMTSNEKKVFLSKLASLKTVAQKSGLPTDKIEAKISEVKGDVKAPVEDIVDYEEFDLDRYDGTPIEKGEAAAEKLLNIDADKVTQGDLAKFKLAVKEGRIKVKGTTLDKIDSLYSKVIDRDKKRKEDKEREGKLLGKGKMLSTEEKEFMKGRKGIKLFTDSYGNEWFERV